MGRELVFESLEYTQNQKFPKFSTRKVKLVVWPCLDLEQAELLGRICDSEEHLAKGHEGGECSGSSVFPWLETHFLKDLFMSCVYLSLIFKL